MCVYSSNIFQLRLEDTIARAGFTQAMRTAAYAAARGRKVCNHNFTTRHRGP
ncbi:MAG: hypothetical protein M0002_03770 [Rhodospirillales bacterium]|nr:hypothetical protein [Rhodospirillales bacterium]